MHGRRESCGEGKAASAVKFGIIEISPGSERNSDPGLICFLGSSVIVAFVVAGM
jgi:hypothetical protein